MFRFARLVNSWFRWPYKKVKGGAMGVVRRPAAKYS